MELNLRDLRYFEVAAQAENLGRAAETIARSQPALTKAIRRLEQTVGGPLFEKAGRGVQLTAVGWVLLDEARTLLASADGALRHVTEFSQGLTGLVRIGSGTVSLAALLPRMCRLLLQQAPQAQVSIEVGASLDLLEQLREKRLDLVVGLLPSEKDPGFVRHPIAVEDVVVVARAHHPIFKSRCIDLETLLEYAWVLPKPQAPSRQWLDAAFTSSGLPAPNVQVESNSIPLLPQLIAGTNLLSFVSRHTIARERSARLREVKPSLLMLRRALGVTSRTGGYLSPAASRLLALLQQEGQALLAGDLDD
jgi:DNA-binding transcriptional LysR family regulator